jgi:hypothetical protein
MDPPPLNNPNAILLLNGKLFDPISQPPLPPPVPSTATLRTIIKDIRLCAQILFRYLMVCMLLYVLIVVVGLLLAILCYCFDFGREVGFWRDLTGRVARKRGLSHVIYLSYNMRLRTGRTSSSATKFCFCKILVANCHVVCLSICNPSLWKVLEIWNHVYKHPLTPPLEG